MAWRDVAGRDSDVALFRTYLLYYIASVTMTWSEVEELLLRLFLFQNMNSSAEQMYFI